MEIIDKLFIKDYWMEFLEYQLDHKALTNSEISYLYMFIQNENFIDVVNKMMSLDTIGSPRLFFVNKKGTRKKRSVYVYNDDEMFILKMISYLLKEYDELFCKNLYSFRSNRSAKKAIYDLTRKVNVYNSYTYKVDVHDYFNSIDANKILKLVSLNLPSETKFYVFLKKMLMNPQVITEDGKTDIEHKGIMAGTPISGFLANLFLSELDYYFEEHRIPYMRYSDDIICFAETEADIKSHEEVIKEVLSAKGLTINEKKEKRTVPGEKIEFLGFMFLDGDIEVAGITVEKLKAKFKRKSKSLYRWKCCNNVSNEKTVKIYLNYVNKKLYNNTTNGEITWCRWYFPVITTDKQLKEIDDYIIACTRYLITGKYGKKNYNLRYSQIREMGYRSLVNNFWKFKKGKYVVEEL